MRSFISHRQRENERVFSYAKEIKKNSIPRDFYYSIGNLQGILICDTLYKNQSSIRLKPKVILK